MMMMMMMMIASQEWVSALGKKQKFCLAVQNPVPCLSQHALVGDLGREGSSSGYAACFRAEFIRLRETT